MIDIDTYDRPPNFLLVDYYNYGKPNGSVFEVAAKMNNVTYDVSKCCGTTSAAAAVAAPNLLLAILVVVMLHGILNF